MIVMLPDFKLGGLIGSALLFMAVVLLYQLCSVAAQGTLAELLKHFAEMRLCGMIRNLKVSNREGSAGGADPSLLVQQTVKQATAIQTSSCGAPGMEADS